MDNQLPKITYLFGAGASALRLPTIKGLPDRIKYIKDYIDKTYIYEEYEAMEIRDLSFKAIDAKKYILEGFDKLYNASQNHSTVDTYAKKLYLTSRNSEVDQLTFFLALYFNIEQKLVGVDPRYNTFLISLLNSSVYHFPKNLKFMSWNYDLQFEIAYSKLLERDGNDLNYSFFNTEERDWSKENFSSIKINGSCNLADSFSAFYNLVSNLASDEVNRSDFDNALLFGFSEIKNRRGNFRSRININFAWYNDLKDKIAELHNQTEVLVVIGYSFPFFNRDVDRRIIRAMSNLKTIYIQDVEPENIVSRFLSILPDWKSRGIEIITINTVDEFFLPPEL